MPVENYVEKWKAGEMNRSCRAEGGKRGTAGRIGPDPACVAVPRGNLISCPACARPERLRREEGSMRNCLLFVQFEDRHRSVWKLCRWHSFSEGRSGYAARREVCGIAYSSSNLRTAMNASVGS